MSKIKVVTGVTEEANIKEKKSFRDLLFKIKVPGMGAGINATDNSHYDNALRLFLATIFQSVKISVQILQSNGTTETLINKTNLLMLGIYSTAREGHMVVYQDSANPADLIGEVEVSLSRDGNIPLGMDEEIRIDLEGLNTAWTTELYALQDDVQGRTLNVYHTSSLLKETSKMIQVDEGDVLITDASTFDQMKLTNGGNIGTVEFGVEELISLNHKVNDILAVMKDGKFYSSRSTQTGFFQYFYKRFDTREATELRANSVNDNLHCLVKAKTR